MKEEINWKERFEREFVEDDEDGRHIYESGDVDGIMDFISSEIIEPLINEIENIEVKYGEEYANDIVFDVKSKVIQQLSSHWLGESK